MMPKAIPPAVAMLQIDDIRRALRYYRSYKSCIAEFESALRGYFGVKYAFVVSSGRAALTLVLRAMKNLRGQTEVVVPDYTCFSVPSAVAKTGLKIAAADINQTDLGYELEHLSDAISPETLAVIVVHPYGLPCRIEQVKSLCSERGVLVIEDAAQAMGARVGDRKVGTFGDVAILSFGRGKSMTTISGGAILTNSDVLADALSIVINKIVEPIRGSYKFWAMAFAYWCFTKPGIFPIVKRLPFLEIGITKFSTSYPISTMTQAQAALGLACITTLDGHNNVRMEHSAYFAEKLGKIEEIRLIRDQPEAQGIYLRQPLLFESTEKACRTLYELETQGLGAGRAYPGCISDIPEAAESIIKGTNPVSKSHDVIHRMFTLPTHYLVTVEDRDRIIKTILRCSKA
jgi:dTDP-4-amino-4,6-dideoxygalactose transaminase